MKTFSERFPGFELKGLKWFRGMEGDGFNVTVLKDGKKLAFVMDDARGGEYDYEFVSEAAEKELKAIVEAKRLEIPAAKMFHGTPDRDLFSMDSMICDMCSAFDFEKKMRRATKTKTVFLTPDLSEGEARVINRPYDPTVGEGLRKKYPGVVILNEVLR